MLTREQASRCAQVTASVSAVSIALAESLPSLVDIRAVLKVALFLTDRFMEASGPRRSYEEEVRQMVIKELGFTDELGNVN